MISARQKDRVTVLTIEHGKANALDLELCRGVVSALDELVREGAEAVVVTGRGSIFSAGVDLKRVVEGGASYLEEFLPAIPELLEAVVEFPRPLVAAMNGHAIAGGCVLACACDRRVATDGGGRAGVPELTVGVPYPTLALEVMRTALAPPAFRDLVLTGRTVEMAEAEELGLVDRTVAPDELLDAACAEAERLANLPADALAVTKRQMWEPALATHRRHLGDWDREVLALWSRDETRERIRAYLDATVGGKG